MLWLAEKEKEGTKESHGVLGGGQIVEKMDEREHRKDQNWAHERERANQREVYSTAADSFLHQVGESLQTDSSKPELFRSPVKVQLGSLQPVVCSTESSRPKSSRLCLGRPCLYQKARWRSKKEMREQRIEPEFIASLSQNLTRWPAASGKGSWEVRHLVFIFPTTDSVTDLERKTGKEFTGFLGYYIIKSKEEG